MAYRHTIQRSTTVKPRVAKPARKATAVSRTRKSVPTRPTSRRSTVVRKTSNVLQPKIAPTRTRPRAVPRVAAVSKPTVLRQGYRSAPISKALRTIGVTSLVLFLIAGQARVLDAFEAHVINVTAEFVNSNNCEVLSFRGPIDWIPESGLYESLLPQQMGTAQIGSVLGADSTLRDYTNPDQRYAMRAELLAAEFNVAALGVGNQTVSSLNKTISELIDDANAMISSSPEPTLADYAQMRQDLALANGLPSILDCPVCGDGQVDEVTEEQCDDGNLENGDGCSAICEIENSECAARSAGYWQNHEGCEQSPAVSIWADEVSQLLSDHFLGTYDEITGEGICEAVDVTNCPVGGSIDARRCKALRMVLADLLNIVSQKLDLNALIAGADDGSAAFDALGLTAGSTIKEALLAVEQILLNPSPSAEQLDDAKNVAERIYLFYENENQDAPHCVYATCGDGVKGENEQCDDGNSQNGDGCSASCTNECEPEAYEFDGYWSDYFNHVPDGVEFQGPITGLDPGHTPFEYDWYDLPFLSFSRVDSDINFGAEFLPIDEGEDGDPYHFTVHWRALVTVPADGVYQYFLTTDDDAWVYIDGTQTTDLGGVHAPATTTPTINLTAGSHTLNIYYAERHTIQSVFGFKWLTEGVRVTPLPPECEDPEREADVVINEYLPNPIGPDTVPGPAGEWVELYNRGGQTIDVDGWVLYDADDTHPLGISDAVTNTGDTVLAPAGFLVVYRTNDTLFTLTNDGGDSVRLFNGLSTSGGQLVDSHSFDDHPLENKSYARIPDGSSNWVDPIPTPGAPNQLGPVSESETAGEEIDIEEEQIENGSPEEQETNIEGEQVVISDSENLLATAEEDDKKADPDADSGASADQEPEQAKSSGEDEDGALPEEENDLDPESKDADQPATDPTADQVVSVLPEVTLIVE